MKRLLFTLPILLSAAWLSAVAPPPAAVAQAPPVSTAKAEKPDWSKKGRGYKPMPEAQKAALRTASFRRHGHVVRTLTKTVTPPATFDTSAMGWSPPVVDQGNCGDCYGVSTCDATTAAFIKAGWGKNDGSFKISDQYGLDCGAFHGGCGGGDEAQVADYMKTHGFPAEKWVDLATGKAQSDYSGYTARPGRCQLNAGAKLWKLQDYGFVGGNGQTATLDEYKAALMTYGQLSIALDAGAFNSYSGGVINRLGNSIDHAISMTGWDDGKKAVRCRNNWGTGWGEGGYCWISYDALPQIVEPIWLLAPALVPPPGPGPGPGPGPTPTGITITSALTATGAVGGAFSYQIAATDTPTEWAAAGLPAGLKCDPATGAITGTPSLAGTYSVTLSAASPTNGTGTAVLVLTVTGNGPVPGNVTIQITIGTQTINYALSADQVQSVIKQSGVTVVTPTMTLGDLANLLRKGGTDGASQPCSGKQTSLEKDVSDVKRGMDALIRFVLSEQKLSPKR